MWSHLICIMLVLMTICRRSYLACMKLSVLVLLMYEVNDVCGLYMSLLSICEVMGLQMYIALVGLNWNC